MIVLPASSCWRVEEEEQRRGGGTPMENKIPEKKQKTQRNRSNKMESPTRGPKMKRRQRWKDVDKDKWAVEMFGAGGCRGGSPLRKPNADWSGATTQVSSFPYPLKKKKGITHPPTSAHRGPKTVSILDTCALTIRKKMVDWARKDFKN